MTLSGNKILTGRALHPGVGTGEVLVLDQPISFWGGVDHHGVIIDVHHPQCGQSVAGRVLVMHSGRGSSSATAVLAELIRAKKAPAAMLFTECDTILVIGALVAAELYAISIPIAELSPSDYSKLPTSGCVTVSASTETLIATIS